MRIRFLETVPSANPDHPFLAGQIIAIERPWASLRTYLRDGKAVVLPEEPELATVAPAERATLPKGKRK